jgi:5'(3')-deoxyribonucleotidase
VSVVGENATRNNGGPQSGFSLKTQNPERRAKPAYPHPMKSLRLGIDLDGVVADFNTGWIERYNAEFARSLPLDAVQTWNGLHTLTHFRDDREFWRWAAGHGGGSIFRHLDTYAGALGSLEELSAGGHDIVIITSKPDWAIHDTYAWLADHRIPTREVHIIEWKWTVPCDVYLDDAPHQLRGLVERRPDATVCRFVRPWNDPVEGAVDVRAWEEFTDMVSRLAE